ncbi:MAG: hypothetical protein AAFZ15_02215 [Bacteroidota bacterium]
MDFGDNEAKEGRRQEDVAKFFSGRASTLLAIFLKTNDHCLSWEYLVLVEALW